MPQAGRPRGPQLVQKVQLVFLFSFQPVHRRRQQQSSRLWHLHEMPQHRHVHARHHVHRPYAPALRKLVLEVVPVASFSVLVHASRRPPS